MTVGRAIGLAALAAAIAATVHLATRPRPASPVATEAAPAYVGSERCQGCHPDAYRAWAGSHHALAMQVARDGTVLGDFGGAALLHRGKTWRFFRRGERFVVHAEGPDGAMADYEVAYTFGVEPLQQYLVPFPRGRFQMLSAAWDARARRWFHVDPRGDAPPGDWLHWTRGGQSWNAMCSDCHATAVRKGYDPEADSYRTTWSEIGVGCEACHGPASRHLAWAERPASRPPAANAGLVSRASKLPGRELVGLCAPCHARRAQFADQGAPGGELLDRFLPTVLSPGTFHPDGQNLDEDFEWHAFTQSVMCGTRRTACWPRSTRGWGAPTRRRRCSRRGHRPRRGRARCIRRLAWTALSRRGRGNIAGTRGEGGTRPQRPLPAEGTKMRRARAMFGMARFVRRTFPLIPIVPIGLLLGSFALSVAAYMKANRSLPAPT